MPKMKRLAALVLVSALLALLGGCMSQNRKPETANSPDAGGSNASGTAAKRFQDTPLQGKTVVESAMELSEKYARLSDQTTALRQENQRLVSENDDLKKQITEVEAKLKQTQKELGEANQLLIDMLAELNNWKTNILGFRGEMREAAKAQLEALLKVLEILGGEAEAKTISRQHEAAVHPNQPSDQTSDILAANARDNNEP
jgi:chromosome segregation ATPase